ncbi:uncharacterized protein MONOS_6361 [Monocercomonoides exilis]|uniref:uncharacterized protein n=1 Tax=Monocercomonoides exilis TaxID=2049356 RepID=UPI00355A5A4D|nr:hypothetical protein MONOS_6361 [Monocercomonoides exilis]|eukprot:MONOS_6361.1-p1 / transcript=MONOS_6361.1 / gene=MONOS_6361 / organism=Monocercomonoides_exilis_PA203 / gene_product=unspecified product / transcript_product=unspecified product / location=Mono_scaffold00199:52638-53813(-) / protein_length=392 / sequence_SO=supercontig / SO=protein_coding / is_pseudo=false
MSTSLEGPASGLSGMFPQSGPTGGMGMAYPISAPTMSTGELHSATFASTSSSSSSSSSASNAMDAIPSEGSTQPLQQAISEIFGDRCVSSVFNYHLNQGDLEQTMREYEPISASPFIPSSTHPHSRSRSWISDALDEGAYNVEMFLIPALKATLLAAHNAVGEPSEHLEESIMFITAALQAARHMRIQAKYGFAAARSLKEDAVDPLLTPEQLERIKPILQANSSKLQSARQGRLAQRPRRQRAQNFSTKKTGFEEQRKHFFSEKIWGRTQAFAKEWKKIGVSNCVANGVLPVWKGKKARDRLIREKDMGKGFIGGPKERRACAEWIAEGLKTDILRELRREEVRCLSNVFFIEKKNGSYRQILDCRPLNAALKDIHFKMEDQRTVEKLLL